MEQPIHNKTSDEAFSDLTSTEKSCLIDVRTTEELYTSGVPDLSNANKTVIFCEWRKQMLSKSTYNFVKELCCKVNITDIKTLYFLCAAGIRSKEAAIWTKNELGDQGSSIRFINISDGFDGSSLSILGLRNKYGWKGSGLPWCHYNKVKLL